MTDETRAEWRAIATGLFADPDAPQVPDPTEGERGPLYLKHEGSSTPPPRNGDHNFIERLFRQSSVLKRLHTRLKLTVVFHQLDETLEKKVLMLFVPTASILRELEVV